MSSEKICPMCGVRETLRKAIGSFDGHSVELCGACSHICSRLCGAMCDILKLEGKKESFIGQDSTFARALKFFNKKPWLLFFVEERR